MLFKMWSYIVGLLVCLGTAWAQSDTLVVQIDQGFLRGYMHERGGVYTFNDVPYATVPSGEDKFKAPLPGPVWSDTFDAVTRNIMCPQPQPEAFPITEDCLVANIFVPETNTTGLPVYVYIHGGAQVEGTGFMYQFTDLVRTEKLIAVTFNYRLGLHGYLCLGTEGVPGNAALKDQVALLRWVQRNIASFGGNPNDVTIGGCSTGGASVEFLSISPMAEGLFNKVITESGSVFGVTSTQGDPIRNARQIALYLNFTNTNDLDALEQFYKTASFDVLLSANEFILAEADGNSILVAPCVERYTGGEMFLQDTPANILKNGNYTPRPSLHGFANMEGLIRIHEYEDFKDRMNENFSDFIPDELYFENQTLKEEFAEKTKQFYFGYRGVTETTILSYIDYFTDVMFGYPMLRTIWLRRQSQNDTIYLYEYAFVDENTNSIPHTTFKGADHCYQAFAIADQNMTLATAEYRNMVGIMRELWLNFIITGNPTPENSTVDVPTWPPVDGYLSPYMSLKNQSTVETTPLLEPRARFWDDIYETNYKQPIPPSGAQDTTPAPATTDPMPDTTLAPTPTTSEPDSAVTSTLSLALLLTVLLINYIK